MIIAVYANISLPRCLPGAAGHSAPQAADGNYIGHRHGLFLCPAWHQTSCGRQSFTGSIDLRIRMAIEHRHRAVGFKHYRQHPVPKKVGGTTTDCSCQCQQLRHVGVASPVIHSQRVLPKKMAVNMNDYAWSCQTSANAR